MLCLAVTGSLGTATPRSYPKASKGDCEGRQSLKESSEEIKNTSRAKVRAAVPGLPGLVPTPQGGTKQVGHGAGAATGEQQPGYGQGATAVLAQGDLQMLQGKLPQVGSET